MSVIRGNADQAILAMAARQHGVISRAQLIQAGLTGMVLKSRVRTGLLVRVHRGVYRVGALELPNAREMAAVLACGRTAVLSGRSAAVVWRLLERRVAEDRVDVTVTGKRPVPRSGILVHHAKSLHPEEHTEHAGIPIVTPARALYDLSKAAAQRELESALAEGVLRQLVDRDRILAVLAHHAGRPGATRLRALLDADVIAGVTRSEAEERFLHLIRKAQLPDPATNAGLEGYEVDFFWRRERLVVEVDGRAFHSSGRRFESDRRRDAVLVAAGVRVMRVTWKQIVSEPEALVARMAQALIRAAPR